MDDVGLDTVLNIEEHYADELALQYLKFPGNRVAR